MENKLSNPKKTIEIIKKYEFAFQKKFGQNFLIDPHVLDKIIKAAGVTKDDCVLEIGPGIGTMTQYLAEAARKVVAVEIDTHLIPILEETLKDYDNITVINDDILKVDIKQLTDQYNNGKPIKVVANLPYYITSPLLVNLLTAELPWESLVVMMQREVAERLVAKPATKAYGTITVLASYYSNVEICQIVPPTVFMPQPAVDSAIVKFTMGRSKVEVVDSALLWQVIKAGFAQRRKTLINSLAATPLGGTIAKSTWRKILLECGIDPQRRAETLTMEDFVVLTNKLSDYYSTV
mgnify:CR=1 FL=1